MRNGDSFHNGSENLELQNRIRQDAGLEPLQAQPEEPTPPALSISASPDPNTDPEIMHKAFEIAGYGEEDLKAKFGALYTAFSYGAPPHAGMAPGVDRMIMLIAEEETIRDVIAFPLNGNAQDLMMGAPGEVTELQLREVHIKVRD